MCRNPYTSLNGINILTMDIKSKEFFTDLYIGTVNRNSIATDLVVTDAMAYFTTKKGLRIEYYTSRVDVLDARLDRTMILNDFVQTSRTVALTMLKRIASA